MTHALTITTARTKPDCCGNTSQPGDIEFRVEGCHFPQNIGKVTKTRETMRGMTYEGDVYSYAGCLVMTADGSNGGIRQMPLIPNGATILVDGTPFRVDIMRGNRDQTTLTALVIE